MLIVCPNCATSYQVEPHSLGDNGRSVRCARCRNVWFASIPAVVTTLPGSDAWDVVDTGPRVPAVDAPPPSAEPARAFASTDGIDMSGLRADLDSQRSTQEAEADAVLAEVGQESVGQTDSLVTDSPPLVPAQDDAKTDTRRTASESDNFESAAQRRNRLRAKQRKPRQKLGLPLLILLLVAANAGLIAWRADIARLLPQTASLYAALGVPVNLRGLAFENVQTSRIEQEGVGVLVVEGSIVNVTRRPVEVPRLRLAVLNEAKREVYSWTALPSRSILNPGEGLPFRSRLASPPAEAHEVQVRFFHRRDMTAGLN